jgi:hypothetical protein
LYVASLLWAGPLGATFLLEVVKNSARGLAPSIRVGAAFSFSLVFATTLTMLAFAEAHPVNHYYYVCLGLLTLLLQIITSVFLCYFIRQPRPAGLDSSYEERRIAPLFLVVSAVFLGTPVGW